MGASLRIAPLPATTRACMCGCWPPALRPHAAPGMDGAGPAGLHGRPLGQGGQLGVGLSGAGWQIRECALQSSSKAAPKLQSKIRC